MLEGGGSGQAADREAFLRRAEGADLEKTKELLNELVGWQKGHAPYQL